ncbi:MULTISPECIES: hypothetical protein [unclassified Roseobacter]|uniref:hypothetical protein n=1 Tax=unclassified Roseobacter TaxID=196798 RepID=UPI001492CE84|nr:MULTISPECIES: hypothetical protein [unclassified Roseobacter]NNW55502.1 hypothetical protein [Roseobacter sp. HKCCD8284]NNY17311.1 hypothetical protein [Roseobacter sp. HKCCD8191]
MTDWADFEILFYNKEGKAVCHCCIVQTDLFEEEYYLAFLVLGKIDFCAIRQMRRKFKELYNGEYVYAYVEENEIAETFAEAFGLVRQDLVTSQGRLYERKE